MKQCWNIKADLSAYVDAELPATRRAEIETHLNGCPDCRQHLAELQRLADGVAQLPRAAEPAGVLIEVRRRLNAAPVKPSRWIMPAWGTAAAGLLVVGVVAWWLTDRQQPQAPLADAKVPARKVEYAKVESVRRVTILPPEEAKSARARSAPAKELPEPVASMPSGAALPVTVPRAEATEKGVVTPADVLTVVSDNVRQVQDEARVILAGLRGRVEAATPTNFMVSLPASNLDSFKARLTMLEAGAKAKKEREFTYANVRAEKLGADVLEDKAANAPAAGAGIGGAVAQQEQMVVIEVRVEQPAGQR